MKKTKLLLLSFFCLIFPSIIHSQCFVDAGPDQIACPNIAGMISPPVTLNASILGGTPPYTIEWDTLIGVGLPIPLNINSFLSNVNILNPTVTQKAADDNLFRLKVTDSLGNVCYDTMKVSFGSFGIIPNNCVKNIVFGDSTQLGTTIGGRAPLTYAWCPNYNISDSTSSQPLVWPSTSTYYNVIVKDSLGCESYFTNVGCSVNIVPVGINSAIAEDHFDFNVGSKITITPKFPLSKSDYSLRIFDVTGKLLNELPIEGQTSLDKLNKGLLIYAIYENEQLVFTRKVR